SPGATAASLPLWQCWTSALAKLRSAKALAWCPWRSGRRSFRTCFRQSRIMGRALMGRLREERAPMTPLCKSRGALPFLARKAAGRSEGEREGRRSDGALAPLDADAAELTEADLRRVHDPAVAATIREQWEALQDESARLLLRVASLFPESAAVP